MTPSLVQLAIELVCLPLVTRVADEAYREQGWPEKDVVEGENRAIVEESAAETDDGSEKAEA